MKSMLNRPKTMLMCLWQRNEVVTSPPTPAPRQPAPCRSRRGAAVFVRPQS